MVTYEGDDMKYLAFRYTTDDRGNACLEEIPLSDDFDKAEDVLAWLATIEGGYTGTRYLVVAAVSWVTATMEEKPVTRYARVDGWDKDTLQERKNEENKLKRAAQLAGGLPADIKSNKDLEA